MHVGVNIGTSAGPNLEASPIGDDVYICLGTEISVPVKAAGRIATVANAVVNKPFDVPNGYIAGVSDRDRGMVNTARVLIMAKGPLVGKF